MIKKTFVIYISQIYKSILPLIFIPLILGILGAEKYGMLAFYYMLIGLLGLLDAGISGTFLKLISTNKNKKNNYKKVTILFFKVLILFSFIALLIQLFFHFNSDFIVTKWLNTKIDYEESIFAIKAIGIIIAFLYIKSYLVSFLYGMEKQELVAVWNIIYSSFFYFGGYLIIRYIDNSLYGFFSLMKLISIFDIIVIFLITISIYIQHLNRLNKKGKKYLDTELEEKQEDLTFKNIFKFSIQLSGLSIIWVIATQIDKFVLSNYILLTEYAKYQIAVQLSSVIAIFSAPISQILLPRLSRLYSEREFKHYSYIYCSSLYIFTYLLAPIIPYFFFFGNNLISLWMGNEQLGNEINTYAKWLVSAAYIVGTMNFIFILLYSINQLKHHFYAYLIYSLVTIPLSIFIAKYYGALTSAKFIFIHTLLFMIIWFGWQIKKHFTKLVLSYLLSFIFVILFSSLIFYLSSIILEPLSNLFIKAILPPIINLSLFAIIYLLVNKKLKILLSKPTLTI
ncbi:lipopolysaccharide biosynthesis protein [Providencia huaxiensis]|uniref:lipopolysaccharide biosynthesis protein n=1 Tax=Providencia huaxiensis TaxID=2027290 RepID=UPI0034E5009A